MSNLKLKISPPVSRTIEPSNTAQLAVNTDANSVTMQKKIPLTTVRNRLRTLRVERSTDTGFRPFRVF